MSIMVIEIDSWLTSKVISRAKKIFFLINIDSWIIKETERKEKSTVYLSENEISSRRLET